MLSPVTHNEVTIAFSNRIAKHSEKHSTSVHTTAGHPYVAMTILTARWR